MKATPMHASPYDAWIGSFALLVIVAGAGVWFEVLRRRRQGVPVVAYEPRRPVPWTAVEMVLILAGYLLLQIVTAYVVFALAGLEISRPHDDTSQPSAESEQPEEMDPQRYSAMLLANALGNVLTAAGAVALLRLRSGASWSDLGLSRPKAHDLVLGLAAFAAAVIPVYGLQAVLIQYFDQRHPIVEMLEEHMTFGLMAVSALTAVAVAPFVEELLFRVALQGWLERVQMRAKRNALEPSASEQEGVATLDEPRLQQDCLMPWPIVLSSLAFALAHLGNGPDPIPLFFLALVLGYVYQRTHRLWPSLVVHFTLNSCSLFVLWLQTTRN